MTKREVINQIEETVKRSSEIKNSLPSQIKMRKSMGWNQIDFTPYPESFKSALEEESLKTLTSDLNFAKKRLVEIEQQLREESR